MPYAEYKAPKGMIKVELQISGNRISNISLGGDFFMYPEDALERLEQSLVGTKFERGELMKAVERFYESGVQTPMVEPRHWVEAILRAGGEGNQPCAGSAISEECG
jgi:hypothetical protein